jgi:chemotaxis protein MotB
MSKDDSRPIIVKRIKKGGHGGHHGGAWKIAYADFVTAMMAFFLLMWLLGSTTKGDLQGISDYFNTPLKVAMAGGSGAGESSSLVRGGGKDLTRSNGQVKAGEALSPKKNINVQAAKAEIARQEKIKLGALKEKLEGALQANSKLAAYRDQIRLDITSEGLRIQIVDEQNRPMFDIGRAVLKEYTREILREIGKLLNEVDNKITLSGHTDSAPYANGEKSYSNWELSADRANASRRELVAAGMDDAKIMRVVGLAASVPFDRGNPLHPTNRRITILVMNKQTEEQVSSGGVSAGGTETEEPTEVNATGPASAATGATKP